MTADFHLLAWHKRGEGIREFSQPVSGTREAIKLLKLLAAYDKVANDRLQKPVQGLRVFLSDRWWEWTDPETGESIHDLMGSRK